VLAAIPCHFAVDDHEFADNFAGAAPVTAGLELQNLKEGGISKEQFEFARDTAQAYMDSGRSVTPFGHLPALNAPTGPAPPRAPARFWYALDDTAEISCPAFILDTRSERERAHGTTPARLMHGAQMAAFLHWLASKRLDPRPKFVFLGSPIIPLTRDFDEPSLWMRQDGPTGYRAELSEIVMCIVKLGIERVVFVGGDPHLSCTATMSLKTDGVQSIDALHVVSSGLYAPLPFANLSPDDVYWSRPSTIELNSCRIDYTAELLIPRPTEVQLPVPPHFIRVSAKPTDSQWTINVEAYGRCGRILANKSFGI
jgi:cholesterol oxidase